VSVIPSKSQRKLIVDLFAGGGGASTGIEAVLGYVDVAINHDPIAIAVHLANHQRTVHYTTNIWDVRPKVATCGRPVLLLHASPDCKHFSRAKGGKPKSQKVRSLPWVVRRWARDVLPDVITMENVPEFVEWGPLFDLDTWQRTSDGEIRDASACPGCKWRPDRDPEREKKEKAPEKHKRCGWRDLSDSPIPELKGTTFRRWVKDLEKLGYVVEWRILKASDFGAPTSRRRLFLVARRDKKPIAWPEKTHGSPEECAKDPRLQLWHTAAECIDWSIPVPSIFERTTPLAANTLKRIAAGVVKFVLRNPRPYIIPVNHSGGEDRAESIDRPLSTVTAARRGHAVVAPTLIQTSYGEREGQAPRVLDLHKPLGTVVAQGQNGLVASSRTPPTGGSSLRTLAVLCGTTATRCRSTAPRRRSAQAATTLGSCRRSSLSTTRGRSVTSSRSRSRPSPRSTITRRSASSSPPRASLTSTRMRRRCCRS
jgi:DNA (cytosine-5)-methyltransferase 1